MKTGAKGKGCAHAAHSQAHAFSLRKTCQVTVFHKHLDAPTRRKPPFGIRGPSRGCRAGVHRSPPLLARQSQGAGGAGGGRPEEGPAGQPSTAGRCRAGGGPGRAGSPPPPPPPAAACGSSAGPSPASIVGRGRRCQTPPGGGWGELREQTASPPARGTGPATSCIRWQGKHQTWARGRKGDTGGRRGGVPPLGSSCVSGRAHLQLPAARGRPLSPRPAEELFRGSLFAGIFPPFPVLAR